MAIKYNGSSSAGQPFEAAEARAVIITGEALDKPLAYEGDTVVYTATAKDDHDEMLPSTFVADLEVNGTKVITGQVFSAAVYDPITFLLTLPWVVPEIPAGNYTVKLTWAEQIL